MAVLKNTLLAASVLASSALAAPFGPFHDIQGGWGPQTKTVTDWITVNEQATVWVDGQGRPIATDFPGGDNASWGASTGAAPTSAAASSEVTSAPAAAAPSEAASSAPTSSPSPSYSPAVFNSEPEPTTTSIWTPEYTPSTAPTTAAPTTAAPTTAASTSSWAPESTPAASPSSTTSAAAAASSSSSSSSSSGGVCVGSSSDCVGDITHWDGGLGACGWNVDTSSDMQIALPYELMGTESNDNPYCGKSLTIVGPSGNQVKATVGDKCMGCTGYSIDLTDILFSTVAPDGNGRVSGIQWYFD